MSTNLLRKTGVHARIPVGNEKLENEILPRLEKVILGPRCVAYTERSVDALIDILIAESPDKKPFDPVPNQNRRAKKAAGIKRPPRKRHNRHKAGR